MKFFKIANLFDCRAQNNKDVSVNLPSWLPAGAATLRWDWSALHTFPNVEFYTQCVDITVSSSSTASLPQTYDVRTVYPLKGNQGVGYRNPFNPGSPQFMTGPACAPGITGQGCDLTADGSLGNTFVDGGTPPSPVDSDSGGSADAGEAPTSQCTIHTVETGDTLTSIANYYTSLGNPTTADKICSVNGVVDCNQIEVGETYVIPGTCGSDTPSGDGFDWKRVGFVFGLLLVGGIVGAAFNKTKGGEIGGKAKKNAFEMKPADLI